MLTDEHIAAAEASFEVQLEALDIDIQIAHGGGVRQDHIGAAEALLSAYKRLARLGMVIDNEVEDSRVIEGDALKMIRHAADLHIRIAEALR